MASIKSRLEEWVSAPKVKIKEDPRKGEVIVEVFKVHKKTSVIVGVEVDYKGELKGDPKNYTTSVFPIAYVLKSGVEEYKEGDIIYLNDEILWTEDNPEYFVWDAKQEHTRPKLKELPPPRYRGGLFVLERYKFKKDKLKQEKDPIDDFLFQIPVPMIRGKYNL